MEPDFSGYVTKAGLECSDGRIIDADAFKHQDGMVVPLVYQHNHTDMNQVMGKVKLTNKPEGVWGDVYTNETVSGKNAKALVEHGDLTKFSIWAKDLVERGANVAKGTIQEVSLVLSGANPGANIANVLAHGDLDTEENLMVLGFDIMHADGTAIDPAKTEDNAPSAEPVTGTTFGDVLGTLNEEQKNAVNQLVEVVAQDTLTDYLTEQETGDITDNSGTDNLEHDNLDNQKGTKMSNAFKDAEKNGQAVGSASGKTLKHDDLKALLSTAKGPDGGGGANAVSSLRELIRSKQGAELLHADDYGVQNIEILFPDAQKLMQSPTWVDRRQEWVKTFINGTSKSPFSRVKTMHADITADEARARGYIKAHQKVDEVFPVFARVTGPAWIYKRQKLDREDIISIVNFDVVAWMKAEMRGKLDEELARAGLFGDGRPTMVNGSPNPDKIKDPGPLSLDGNGIRAVINENDLYAQTFDVPMVANPVNSDWNILLDTATEASEFYLGSGNKTAFVSYRVAAKMLTMRDDWGKRLYRSLSEVAGDMDVANIVRVPTELMPTGILAIVLDLSDYNFGTDRGGELTMFDDFDIDFNQYKYLMEVFLSGALTIPYCAQIFRKVDVAYTHIAPTKPTQSGNNITIPTQTGVVYKNADTGATLANGSTVTLSSSVPVVNIEASPTGAFYFGDNRDDTDTFTFEYTP